MHLPAEWSPHEACFTAWPADEALWPGVLDRARAAVAEMCRVLGTSERVALLVAEGEPATSAESALADAPGVEFVPAHYGDIWVRDTGPVFGLDGDGRRMAARFGFNGWGGRFIYPFDDTIGDDIADLVGAPVRRFDWIFEGGAIDTDGEGTLLTTRECLLNRNRRTPGRPAADEATWEARLRDAFGAERVVWLDRGLRWDHTDGHVDNLARFVAPGRVLCMQGGPQDPHRTALVDAETALKAAELDVITLPSPGRVDDREGRPMPASYLNFVVGNGAVVVPTYDVGADREAVDTLARLFPDRRVVGVDAWAVLHGGGAFHCITQPVPAEAPDVGRR